VLPEDEGNISPEMSVNVYGNTDVTSQKTTVFIATSVITQKGL
jgi:hypothetical protein